MEFSKLNIQKGLSIRPSKPTDKVFLEQLYKSTRDDLKLIDGNHEFVEALLNMQKNAQTDSYGSQFPDAMYFVVEKQQRAIGKVTIDFGQNEIRVMDIAFIPEARGRGYGEAVLQCLKQVAAKIFAPVTLTVASDNLIAKRLYIRLGFAVESISPPYEFMVWYPEREQQGSVLI